MQLSVSSWSCHSLFLNKRITPEQFLNYARSVLGLKHVEFFEGDLADHPSSIAPDVLHGLGESFRHGVSICAVSAKNDLMTPNDDAADDDVKRLLQWIEIAPRIGCKVLRVNTGLQRPTLNSYERGKQRLSRLLPQAQQAGVTLVVENHPHPVRTQNEFQEFLSFVRDSYDQGLRICLDTGAFSRDFSVSECRDSLLEAAKLTGHVHLKYPPDSRFDDSSDSYIQTIRKLMDVLTDDVFCSIEFVELAELDADPLTEIWQACKSLQPIFGCSPASAMPSTDSVLQQQVVNPREVSGVKLPKSILPIVALGCEQQIGSRVSIKTFADNEFYHSHDWEHGPHRRDLCRGGTDFCNAVKQNTKAGQICDRFVSDKLDAMEHDDSVGEVCQCPFGVTMMFQPIASKTQLYGGIVCGAWREEGTEGAFFFSIDQQILNPKDSQYAANAVETLPPFSVTDIQNASDSIDRLVDDLTTFYKLAFNAEQVNRHEKELLSLSHDIRKGFQSLDGASGDLRPIVRKLRNATGMSAVAVYLMEYDEKSPVLAFELLAAEGSDSKEELVLRDVSNTNHSFLESLHDNAFRKEIIDGLHLAKPHSELCQLTDSKYVMLVADLGDHGEPQLSFLNRLWHETEHALRNAARLDEAREQTEKLSLVADTARHSLNAPLQGIESALGRLRSKMRREGGDTSLVNKALDFVDEAATAVDRLSAVSLKQRIMLRERRSFSQHEIDHIIRRASRPVTFAGRDRGIKIAISSTLARFPAIECDKEQMRVLFSNLLENAVKYSHRNRTVKIQGQDLTNATTPGVRITVRDYGLGIPERYFESIFEPYEQVPIGDTKRSISGTGLGLYICKEIIDGHNGTLSVSCDIPDWKRRLGEPKMYQGCWVEFALWLPINQPKDDDGEIKSSEN